ncbi:PAT complex subunit CCDC47 isoform X2 [Homalodisca vitripennis]|uniref:PAT complex subunit CCDC47 isoform X2 n=1 Tax=Homalodisca vitripennis TaxID=197043 RepID=UPI001EEC0306|nr:PAT complex subunit CCDC47 isoform X2 [Homalodisca vitripennis]
MRLFLALVVVHIALVGTHVWASAHYRDEMEDSEFAEFEDFEEDESAPVEVTTSSQSVDAGDSNGQDDDEIAVVEDEESEFDHFQDDEEFEGYDSERLGSKVDEKEAPKITITKVPLHLRSNWDSFYLEMLMIAGLVVYFINFFAGQTKNYKLANVWYSTHKSLLEENFSLVGDDGRVENESPGLMKDSDSQYTLWCSGRTCCEGMLVELKMIKRQDLVAVIAQLMRPVQDQVHIRVDMGKDEMDTFVFCVATKKTAVKLAKDMADVSVYCPERRAGDKFGLPASLNVLSELAEVSQTMLDSKVTAALNKYADLIDYIHFSDQFSGPKQTEETTLVKLPDVKKVLMFGLNMPLKGRSVQEAMEHMRPLIQLLLFCCLCAGRQH